VLMCWDEAAGPLRLIALWLEESWGWRKGIYDIK